jgi:hypothetical protein
MGWGVLDTLAEEIRKQTPAWSILRLIWPGITVGFVLSLGIIAAIMRFGSLGDEGLGGQLVVAGMIIAFGTLILGLMLFHGPATGILPGFEIVEIGSRSKARSVGAVVGGLISGTLTVAGIVLTVAQLVQG